MNNVKLMGRKINNFGNKRANKWDGRSRRSEFGSFDTVKAQFESAIHDARWEDVGRLGEELLSTDIKDFSAGEVLFVNTALPRIKHYIHRASDVLHLYSSYMAAQSS